MEAPLHIENLKHYDETKKRMELIDAQLTRLASHIPSLRKVAGTEPTGLTADLAADAPKWTPGALVQTTARREVDLSKALGRLLPAPAPPPLAIATEARGDGQAGTSSLTLSAPDHQPHGPQRLSRNGHARG